MYNMISFDTLYVSKKLHMEAKIMKKAVFLSIAIIIMTCCFLVLVSCNEEPIITDYTISYHDANGLQSITVQKGSSYSIDYIPIKAGHVFLGWYNQETGGTQYVSATGACVSVFNDSQNLMLFPQFAPKTYTLVLDYQGAEVTGSRSFEVVYNEVLPNLPTNPTKEHMVFKGWYTAPNGGGTQIADKYGVIPTKDKLTESTFNLSNNDVVTLYAAFELEKYNVTLYFDSNEPEEIKVEYGTWITDITYETRVNNQAVLTWSKTKNDTTLSNVFSGKITQDVILYATEYAPVINFDTDGGEVLPPIINRAGTNIVLPTPTKELYQFIGWQNNNEDYTSTTMPSESITLTAKWQAKIIFDENGGEEVDDISLKQGTEITLPVTNKNGYVFAGWYDTKGKLYATTAMPSESIKLKAGWYKVKTAKTVIISDSANLNGVNYLINHISPEYINALNLNFTKIIPELDWSTEQTVKINFYVDICHTNAYGQGEDLDYLYYTKEHFYFYSQPQVSDAYLLKKVTLDHGNGQIYTNWKTMEFTIETQITGGMLYTAFGSDVDKGSDSPSYYFNERGEAQGWSMNNFWAEIEYADTSVLY